MGGNDHFLFNSVEYKNNLIKNKMQILYFLHICICIYWRHIWCIEARYTICWAKLKIYISVNPKRRTQLEFVVLLLIIIIIIACWILWKNVHKLWCAWWGLTMKHESMINKMNFHHQSLKLNKILNPLTYLKIFNPTPLSIFIR